MTVECKELERETDFSLDMMKIRWNLQLNDGRVELMQYLNEKQVKLQTSVSDMKTRLEVKVIKLIIYDLYFFKILE